MNSKLFPYCWDDSVDCFALTNNGKCKCLERTNFLNKDGSKRKCPFYKPFEPDQKGKKENESKNDNI